MSEHTEQPAGIASFPFSGANGVKQSTPDLYIQSSVKINGKISGTLVISEHGKLEGSVNAERIIIHGSVDGVISADEYIKIHATAQVRGVLKTGNIQVENGADCNFKAITGEAELQKDERDLSELVALKKVFRQKQYINMLVDSPSKPKPVDVSVTTKSKKAYSSNGSRPKSAQNSSRL